MKFYNKWPFHIAVIVFSIVADQLTKLWALARFTNETGAPNHDVINILGEFLRFQLVFNKGAAFSSRPQDLIGDEVVYDALDGSLVCEEKIDN